MDRIDCYEKMFSDLTQEFHEISRKMEELRQQEKTKTVTYKTLFARKLLLREWLDTYNRYGIQEVSQENR